MKRSFTDIMRGIISVLIIIVIILLIISGIKHAIEKKESKELRQPVVDAKIAAIEKSLAQTNFKVTVYRSFDGGETFYLACVAYRDGPMYDAKLKFWNKNDGYGKMQVDIKSEEELTLDDWNFSNVKAYNSFPNYARGFLMKTEWVPLTVDEVEEYEDRAQYISVESNQYKKYHWSDGGIAIDLVDEIINEDGLLLEYSSRTYSYNGKRSDGKIVDHVIVSELGQVSIPDEMPTYGTIRGAEWKGKIVFDSTPSTKNDWEDIFGDMFKDKKS